MHFRDVVIIFLFIGKYIALSGDREKGLNFGRFPRKSGRSVDRSDHDGHEFPVLIKL